MVPERFTARGPRTMRCVVAIARNTLSETVRQPAYALVLVACCSVIALAPRFSGHIYTYGAGSNLDKPAERMVATLGLSTLLVAGIILGAVSTINVVSREIENRTAMTVLSKRVGRWQFILGKNLGVGVAVGAACGACLLLLLLILRAGVNITNKDAADTGIMLSILAILLVSLAAATLRNYYWGRAWVGTFTLFFMALVMLAFLGYCLVDKEYYSVFAPPTGEIFNSLHYDNRVRVGVTYDWEVMKAGLASIASVLVMTAIAMAASTRLAPGGNLAVTAIIGLLGLTSQYFRDRLGESMADSVAWTRYDAAGGATIPEMAYNVYYALVPNLQHLWLSEALERENAIPWPYVGMAVLYAALYGLAMVFLSVFLFGRREVG